MFESSHFLDLYLPAYFENVFKRTYSTSSTQKTNISYIAILASFLKFTHQLYITIDNQNQFNQFVFNQFNVFSMKESSLSGKLYKKEQNKLGGKIMEFIESNIDKVSLTFVQLYLKLFQIQYLTSRSLPGKDTTLYSQKLLKALNEARLQYEMYRFEISNLKDYDEYILEIFSIILNDNVSQEMESVLRLVMESQYSNLNDNVLLDIESLLNRGKPVGMLTPPASPKQKETFMLLKNVLRKKAKKIEKIKSSPIQRKIINNDRSAKKETLFTSPNKTSNNRHKQSHSPLNRIQNYAKIKKQKPINKKRTIYYQRKNLYLPKMREWIDKMQSFPTEITFSSSEKDKDKKRPYKFQHSQSTYDDYDNQSVLVRSTPKPTRKMNNMKIISHKLDF